MIARDAERGRERERERARARERELEREWGRETHSIANNATATNLTDLI